jgi:hypothetical protein
MSWLHKAKGVFKEFGPVRAWLYLAQRAFGLIGGEIYFYEFVAQAVAPEPFLRNGRGRTIAVRRLSVGDLAFETMSLKRHVIEYRTKQHAICMGAFVEEKMIGYLWLCLGPYQEDEVTCKFIPSPAAHAAWDFDVYLLPQYRLGLGFLRLWDEANQFLRSHGIRWSISRISILNSRSLASHARLGARPCGKALFVRAGSVQVSIASMKPYVRVSWGGRCSPEFVIHAPVES